MIVSSSAMSTRVTRGTPPRREDRDRSELELPAQLVTDEGTHDGEPGAGPVAADPLAVVGDRQHDLAVPPRKSDRHRRSAVLEGVLEELGEDERERGRLLARERHGREARGHLLPGDEALDEHRPQPVDELAEVDVVLAVLGQHLVHCGDGEDPVDRVLERLVRVDVLRTCLQAEERGDRLEVVLDAVVDLLGEDTAHDRAPVLQRDRRVVRDRLEQRLVVARERRVAVADELADLPSFPAQGHAYGIGARAALGPRDLPVLENERRPVACSDSIVVFTIASSDSSR